MEPTPAPEPFQGPPWADDWDEIVVRLLATGLVELEQRASGGRSLRLPYPVALQRGFDRLTLMCLAQEIEPPASVADLIAWCSEPFDQWNFRPRADGADDWVQLLVDGRPSADCLEWYVTGDVEAEYREQKLVLEAMAICREHDRPESYVAFREMLIRRPVVTELEFALALATPDLVCVASQLQRAYAEPSPETVRENVVRLCAHCGCALVPNQGNLLHCAEPDCRDTPKVGRELPIEKGVRAVGREVLTWVTRPGRAELRIFDRLVASKLAVALWPDFDDADLRVEFMDGAVWYADVKTWANPVRLARRMRARPFRAPADANRAFLVVGKDQTRHRERRYMETLANRNHSLRRGSPVPAVTERSFIAEVISHAKQAADA